MRAARRSGTAVILAGTVLAGIILMFALPILSHFSPGKEPSAEELSGDRARYQHEVASYCKVPDSMLNADPMIGDGAISWFGTDGRRYGITWTGEDREVECGR